jgi:hypothetical protein
MVPWRNDKYGIIKKMTWIDRESQELKVKNYIKEIQDVFKKKGN